MLLFFVVVAMASARRANLTETIGPIVVYDWFWVGLAIAHALLGNLWATLSPFDTIGRLVGFEDRAGRRPYPQGLGTVAGGDPALRVRVGGARRPVRDDPRLTSDC